MKERKEEYHQTEEGIKELDVFDEQCIGRISEVQKNSYLIRYLEKEIPAKLSGKFYKKETMFPVVGDYVTFRYNPKGDSKIIEICERKNFLTRPDTAKSMKEQPMAANIDYAFLVMSLNDNFSVNRAVRYAATVLQEGVQPIVILTKADLCPDVEILKEQIKELVERSESIGAEAKQLTHALRGDSKIQGDWGEMILESILEKSGLEKDREYFIQETLRDEEGHTIQGSDGRKMRPDVIIRYPGGENHQMVIDSKVSLTAYVNYVNAEDADEARLALKQHLVSVKKHIDELAGKSYQDYVGKGDHVMMFIPNEAAYLAAMQADHALWQYAYEKKVLLLSPTNLIAALKLVADLWQRDKQTRNAIDIAEEGGKLYDKFAGFVEDMEKIGKSLNTTAMAYTDAMKKLKTGNGNLIGRVEKLKVMGVKAKKNLPAVNEAEEEN